MAKGVNWTAWLFNFVGSLIYLYVVWSLWWAWPSWYSNTQAFQQSFSGAPQSVLFALSVTMSISFFVVTLVGLKTTTKAMLEWAMKAAFIGGLALIALTATPGASPIWFWLAVAGFLLTDVGTGMASM